MLWRHTVPEGKIGQIAKKRPGVEWVRKEAKEWKEKEWTRLWEGIEMSSWSIIILLFPTDTENFRFKSHLLVSDQGTVEHIGAIFGKSVHAWWWYEDFILNANSLTIWWGTTVWSSLTWLSFRDLHQEHPELMPHRWVLCLVPRIQPLLSPSKPK